VQMFSVIWIVLLLSIAFVISNKKLRKNYSTVLLLLWFFVFFIFVSITPHKEDRFFLPVTPAIAMISGLFLTSFKKGNYILFFISFLLILSLAEKFSTVYRDSYTQTNECFLEANKFLQDMSNNSVVITEESPIVYYYTKKETHFYPNPFSADSITDLIIIYGERPVYTLISDYDDLKDATRIKEILDSKFEIVFRCPENGNSSLVYK
jgi:hypothetical protein